MCCREKGPAGPFFIADIKASDRYFTDFKNNYFITPRFCPMPQLNPD
jgi:hypothetical protein